VAVPPGEEVNIILECGTATAGEYSFVLQIFHHLNVVLIRSEKRRLTAGQNKIEFSWQPPLNAPAGYGVEILLDDAHHKSVAIETAFDVLADWTYFPRYGYMCDFSPLREHEQETMQLLSKYHINGLQFYDWQYRHDELVPPQENYLDPLSRPLSLHTTKNLIMAAHDHGMAAMPYLAIYAASASFWKSHPDWMLYDGEHNPIPFGVEFLGIMNPVAGGDWQKHLLNECKKVLQSLPFDGLHIDQYGEPKTGFDEKMQPVDLPKAFGDFVRTAVEQHPGKPVLFNAVGNWPIESLAASPTTFNYIEVWPPDIYYTDLVRIVRNARRISGEKPVVIALYLSSDRAVNNQLADALIFSAGGTRIEVGEEGRLLADPYFPKHEEIPYGLGQILRKQADFIIRYENWFGPLIPESTGPDIKVPEGVATFFRKGQRGVSISLVNLKSESPLCWNEEHPEPDSFTSLDVEISLEHSPKNIWLVTPDRSSLAPIVLEFIERGNMTIITIPGLDVWNVLLIEFA